jgi:hypothetical protein
MNHSKEVKKGGGRMSTSRRKGKVPVECAVFEPEEYVDEDEKKRLSVG